MSEINSAMQSAGLNRSQNNFSCHCSHTKQLGVGAVQKSWEKVIVSSKEHKDLVTHDLMNLCRKCAGLAPAMSTKQGQNKYAGDIIDLIDLLKSLGFVHTMNKRDYKSHVKDITKLGLYPNLQEGYEKL